MDYRPHTYLSLDDWVSHRSMVLLHRYCEEHVITGYERYRRLTLRPFLLECCRSFKQNVFASVESPSTFW